ncbi:hypothetical protein AD998_15760 [bacterium 336/3]|nr:hypothetical protein AD998_15760 [bacterium 336/3]
MKNLLIIFFVLGITISCTKNKKFDSHQWKYSYKGEGHFYFDREVMLQDLIKGNYLTNKHQEEIIELLGKPDIQSNNPQYELAYTIEIEWGKSLAPEPVYSKSLIVLLDKNFVFKDYKIVEWEK